MTSWGFNKAKQREITRGGKTFLPGKYIPWARRGKAGVPQLWLRGRGRGSSDSARGKQTSARLMTQQKNHHGTLPRTAPSPLGTSRQRKHSEWPLLLITRLPLSRVSQIFPCLAVHRFGGGHRHLGLNARGARTGPAGRGGRGGCAARAVPGPLRLPAPRQEAGSGRGAGQARWRRLVRGAAGQVGLGVTAEGRAGVGCAGRVSSPPPRWCRGEAAAAGRGGFSFPGRQRGLPRELPGHGRRRRAPRQRRARPCSLGGTRRGRPVVSAACPGPGPCPALGDFYPRECASGSGVAFAAVGVVKVLPRESRPAVGMSQGVVPPRSPPRERNVVLRWFPGAAVPDRPNPLSALRAGCAWSRGDEQHWSRTSHLFCVPLEES